MFDVDGVDLTQTVEVTDLAGNTAPATSALVDCDTMPPIILGSRSPEANARAGTTRT